MQSAWICTRNDVLGNLAVLLAAIGVFGTGTVVAQVPIALRAGTGFVDQLHCCRALLMECPLWVISRHNGPFASCPLYPR
jgi:hypothetical protein